MHPFVKTTASVALAALLVAAGVLKRERNGQRVRYWLKNQLITRLCEAVCASLETHETAGNFGEMLA